MYGMSACHDGTASRRAYRGNIVVVEDDSAVGQGVNVGSGDLRPMEPHIIPALQQSENIPHLFCRVSGKSMDNMLGLLFR